MKKQKQLDSGDGKPVANDTQDAASTMAELSRSMPRPERATAQAMAATHAASTGTGAFVFKKHSDQAGSYTWDPKAIPPEPTKLGLGQDLTALMFQLARHHKLDGQKFVAFCAERTAEVRAAAWRYREQGQQRSEFDAIVAAFSEASCG